VTIYLQYEGIDGDVTSAGHEKWIECNSFQFGIGRGITSSVSSAADREGTAASVSEIVVTKSNDAATQPLYKAALHGEGKTVKIDFCRTKQGGGEEPYMQFELEQTLVSGHSMSSGGDRPMESLSLNFIKITYANIPAGASLGSEATTRVIYDLTTQTVG
jgi:type VI secretion system secreted protein Hcp